MWDEHTAGHTGLTFKMTNPPIIASRANLSSPVFAAHALPTTIIGDFDDEVASVGVAPWVAGYYSGCSDSHGDFLAPDDGQLDFHHDDGGNKGMVKAHYTPSLPAYGCYRVSE